jgi:uncharacterized repeat protein (TIGR03833 family)
MVKQQTQNRDEKNTAPEMYGRTGTNARLESINRDKIKPGLHVAIVMKEDQRTVELTEGYIKEILTKSPNHPHGIKVRLETGEVGRVKKVFD